MTRRILAILAVLCFLCTAGFAQSIDGVITGRVEDSSGARIPGVTITITSPALLGERQLVTDEGGNYRFQNLAPGTYAVKYELPGFKTMIRQGIIVEASRVVTLVIAMEVAAVAETITVTGESPVVDLEKAAIGINYGSAIKDNVVNARNYWALLATTPGFRTTTPDVGGSTMGTQVGYSAYGMGGQNQVFLDGVNLTEGNSGGSLYGDYGSWEEVQVSAAGNSAEMNTAGASIVAVVRSGGNDLKGSVFVSYENDRTQWNNLTDALRLGGITAGDAFTRYTDWNLDVGGPIMKDKFWYYTSYRNEYSGLATSLRQSGGTKYVLPASGIAPNLCGPNAGQLPCAVEGSPDGAPAGGLFYTRLRNLTSKLTFQINPANQLTATGNVRHKLQPFRGGSGSGARNHTPETTFRQDSWFHTFKAQWVSTLSNRTTLDVSANNFGYYWPNSKNTTGPRINDAGDSGLIGGYNQGADQEDLNNRRRWHQNVVVSHFFDGLGGNHNMKIGYIMQWEDQRFSDFGYEGHIRYRFNEGAPYRIEIQNTPSFWSQENLWQNALYFQDKWQIGTRLTLNLGIRFDRYTNFLPEQIRERAEVNPFNLANDIPGLETFGAKKFPKRPVATFNNPVPRLNLIYDIFGTGRTAIKGSYGRFSFNPADGLAGTANDNGTRTAVYNWNGTLPITPDTLRTCLTPGGGCSVQTLPNLTQTAIDPNLKNAHISEFTAGIDHQLFGDWHLRGNWVKKIEEGSYGTYNRAYSKTDYRAFQFRDAGRDGVLWTDDDQILTAFERAVASRPEDPIVVFSPDNGDRYTTYEIEAVKRMSNRWQLITGADWTQGLGGFNHRSNDMNDHVRAESVGQNRTETWNWSYKLIGTWSAPYGINFSSVLKTQNGGNHGRTFTVNCNTVRAPNQTCAQAGGRQPAQGNITRTVERGDTFKYPALTLWDIRLAKQHTFEQVGTFEAIFDLFNVINANTIRSRTTSSSTTRDITGTTVQTFFRPTSILGARIFRLGLKYSF